MTLPDPASLLEDSGEDPHDSPTASGDLTHVSGLLAESGIPVADSLKARMLEELVRIIEEEEPPDRECSARRSE